MPKSIFTRAAQADLRQIARYLTIAGGDRAIALGFVSTLRLHSEKLAILPGTLGRPRPELSPGLRSFPFKGYLIFFRYNETGFVIARIVSERQDLSMLREES